MATKPPLYTVGQKYNRLGGAQSAYPGQQVPGLPSEEITRITPRGAFREIEYKFPSEEIKPGQWNYRTATKLISPTGQAIGSAGRPTEGDIWTGGSDFSQTGTGQPLSEAREKIRQEMYKGQYNLGQGPQQELLTKLGLSDFTQPFTQGELANLGGTTVPTFKPGGTGPIDQVPTPSPGARGVPGQAEELSLAPPKTSDDLQKRIQGIEGKIDIYQTMLKEAQKMGYKEGEDIPEDVITKILQDRIGGIEEEIEGKQALLAEAKKQGVLPGEEVPGTEPTTPTPTPTTQTPSTPTTTPTATPGGGTTAYQNLLGGAGDLFQQYTDQISGALTGFGEQVEASQDAMRDAYAGVASAYTDIADALKNQPSMVEQYNQMMDDAQVPEMKGELARLQGRATQIEEQIETLPEDVKGRVKDFLMTQTQFDRVTAAEAEPLTKLYNALARASEAKGAEISATRAEVNDVMGLMQKDMDRTMAALQWGLEGAKSSAELESKLSEMGIEYSQLALQTSMAMAGQALETGMGELDYRRDIEAAELDYQRGLPEQQANIAYKQAMIEQATRPETPQMFGSAEGGYFSFDPATGKVTTLVDPGEGGLTNNQTEFVASWLAQIAGFGDRETALTEVGKQQGSIIAVSGQEGYDKLLAEIDRLFPEKPAELTPDEKRREKELQEKIHKYRADQAMKTLKLVPGASSTSGLTITESDDQLTESFWKNLFGDSRTSIGVTR